jgi:hypothetical protein
LIRHKARRDAGFVVSACWKPVVLLIAPSLASQLPQCSMVFTEKVYNQNPVGAGLPAMAAGQATKNPQTITCLRVFSLRG